MPGSIPTALMPVSLSAQYRCASSSRGYPLMVPGPAPTTSPIPLPKRMASAITLPPAADSLLISTYPPVPARK